MSEAIPHYVTMSQLRIGHYIYLDMGWLTHPFPVSSFEILTHEQLQQVRALGIEKIRYDPAKSHLNASELAETVKHAETNAAAVANNIESAEEKQHRQQLLSQQASLLMCERQFGQATRDFKNINDQIYQQPQAASDAANKLVVDILDGMLTEDEIAIRLLSERSGEKTAMHSVNVTLIALLLGKMLALDKNDMLELGVGALLHDIGKMELPERLRSIDEDNTHSEIQLHHTHVEKGVMLGRKMQLSPNVLLAIAQHHECADGSGYPLQIRNDKMSVQSRILSLVNRFDNLCNPTNPLHALTPHEALSLLFSKNKLQSDGAILPAFIKMMGIYPPGSVVQLNDDRYAMVVSVNSTRPIKPSIIVYEPTVPPDAALMINLENEHTLGIRRSLRPVQLPRSVYDYLAPRRRLCYFFERVVARPSMIHSQVAD